MNSTTLDQTTAAEWQSVDEAYPQFKRFFCSKAAFQYHLAHRERNGLAARDAVRKSSLGILLIHSARFEGWVLAENGRKDAA